jgi:hypothetical protein
MVILEIFILLQHPVHLAAHLLLSFHMRRCLLLLPTVVTRTPMYILLILSEITSTTLPLPICTHLLIHGSLPLFVPHIILKFLSLFFCNFFFLSCIQTTLLVSIVIVHIPGAPLLFVLLHLSSHCIHKNLVIFPRGVDYQLIISLSAAQNKTRSPDLLTSSLLHVSLLSGPRSREHLFRRTRT